MEQYNVTGMSCAACSARVEKAVRAALLEQSCALHRVIADRVLYKHIGAEVVPIRCSVILGAILGLDKVQGLPVRVAAGSPNLLLQKGSDCKHILHQPVNVTKHIVIDLLQHVPLLTAR